MNDLVEVTRLRDTTVSPRGTTHCIYEGHNRWRSETWIRSEELGHGSYGAVWLEREEESNKVRAVKQVRRRSTAWDYKKEIAAMAMVRQFPKHFAWMHGWYDDKDWIYLAMDFFELGDLSLHLDEKIPEEQAKTITQQLCHGLLEMHRMGFTHRDLKPQNIFVAAKPPRPWAVRIGDFGITKRVQENETLLRTMTGTQAYMAPEMFPYLLQDEEEHAYTQAVDMWALGVLLYQMMTLELPFGDHNPLHKYCKGRAMFPEAKLVAVPATRECTAFVKHLVQPRPNDRLTSTDAVSQAWLQQEDPRPADAALEHGALDNYNGHEHEREDHAKSQHLHRRVTTVDWASPWPRVAHSPKDMKVKIPLESMRTTGDANETPISPAAANITSIVALRLPSYPISDPIDEEGDAASLVRPVTTSEPKVAETTPQPSATATTAGEDYFTAVPTETSRQSPTSSTSNKYDDHISPAQRYYSWETTSYSVPVDDNTQNSTATYPQPITPPQTELYWNYFEDAKGKLPPGWERRYNPAGKVYYVDHNTQRTTFLRPSPSTIGTIFNDPPLHSDGPHRGSDASASSLPSPAKSKSSIPASPAPPLPSRRKPVGRSSMAALEALSKIKSVDSVKTADAGERSQSLGQTGEELKSISSESHLRLTVVGAKGLKHRKHLSDAARPSLWSSRKKTAPLPYPLVELYIGNEVKRTKPLEGTLNPVWNEGFVVRTKEERPVRIAVYDNLRGTEPDRGFLGLVTLHVSDLLIGGNKNLECKLGDAENARSSDVTGMLELRIEIYEPPPA